MREPIKKVDWWDVFVDPARKIRIGNKIVFWRNDELTAEVIDNTTTRKNIAILHDAPYPEFKKTNEALAVKQLLPKYIKRRAY